jgi:hypothetical protein
LLSGVASKASSVAVFVTLSPALPIGACAVIVRLAALYLGRLPISQRPVLTL